MDNNDKISDDSLSVLTDLTYLDMSHNYVITDNSLRVLTNLAHLGLSHNYKITDTGLSGLIALTSLDISLIQSQQITGAGLLPLSNLKVLSMVQSPAEDRDLLPLTALEKLTVSGNLTGKCLKSLPQLVSLTLFPSHHVQPKYLAKLTNLTSLVLDGCGPVAYWILEGLSSLKSLSTTVENHYDTLSNLTHLQVLFS
jgi:hypothetical protein